MNMRSPTLQPYPTSSKPPVTAVAVPESGFAVQPLSQYRTHIVCGWEPVSMFLVCTVTTLAPNLVRRIADLVLPQPPRMISYMYWWPDMDLVEMLLVGESVTWASRAALISTTTPRVRLAGLVRYVKR